MGVKSITAPCIEILNDRFEMKVYNPENEKRSQLIKFGIWAGGVGVLALLVGRWMGMLTERQRQKKRTEWESESSGESSSKLKRRHVREWN
jgi:cytoskeletal protein RodZ